MPGINKRIANDGRKVKALAAERDPFVHGLLENLERHDSGLQSFICDDFRVGAEGAFGVADVRHAGHEITGRHELAMSEQFFRRDVVFGKFLILPRANKILDVISAPISKIGCHSVRVDEVVDAPAELLCKFFHAKYTGSLTSLHKTVNIPRWQSCGWDDV